MALAGAPSHLDCQLFAQGDKKVQTACEAFKTKILALQQSRA
jgi:hypothetical protein